jgi:prepilin-type N-terminal cleavage/methylation domain-containing protein
MKVLRNQSGLSLPEVLAAMVVLSLGILGLAPMMAISIDGSVHADNVTSVIATAQQRVEEKLANGIVGALPITEIEQQDNGKYTITTVITDATIDTLIPEHVYKIDVSVNWMDDDSVGRSMGFVTYTAKP